MRWLILLLAACAPDLRTLNRFRLVGAEFAEGQHFISKDGVGQVNAAAKDVWIYIDLETSVEVTEADPWDLAFQRFKVRTREIAELDWYDYNLNNHTLVAKDVEFFVDTPEMNRFKIRMLNYYDATGSGGFPAFKYEEVK